LIEGHGLRGGVVDTTCDRIGSAERELLQDVILKRRSRNCRSSDNRKGNANPFTVEEEEKPVVNNRPAKTAPEMIYRGTRLVIAGSGVGEEVGGIEARAVPEFIEIAMKLIGPGFGDVVHLRGTISSLVNGVRKRVNRHL